MATNRPIPADAAPAKTPADLMPIFQQAWLDWMQGLARNNQLPLSGNVDQWIKTWGQSVAQVGLFNVNVANSSDPELEKEISGEFSYGRQLGRILDVLGPLVEAADSKVLNKGDRNVDEFRTMVKRIHDLKARSVEDIVDDVRQWGDTPASAKDLAALIGRLEQLRKSKG